MHQKALSSTPTDRQVLQRPENGGSFSPRPAGKTRQENQIQKVTAWLAGRWVPAEFRQKITVDVGDHAQRTIVTTQAIHPCGLRNRFCSRRVF